jgi:hypothetical protein
MGEGGAIGTTDFAGRRLLYEVGVTTVAAAVVGFFVASARGTSDGAAADLLMVAFEVAPWSAVVLVMSISGSSTATFAAVHQ